MLRAMANADGTLGAQLGPARPGASHGVPHQRTGFGPTGPIHPTTSVLAAARAFSAALKADPNYCRNIGVLGSAVNTTGSTFKTLYDVAMSGRDGNPLVHNGLFDAPTQLALVQVLAGGGYAPPACV